MLDGLKAPRIGVLTQAYRTPTTDPEILSAFATVLTIYLVRARQ